MSTTSLRTAIHALLVNFDLSVELLKNLWLRHQWNNFLVGNANQKAPDEGGVRVFTLVLTDRRIDGQTERKLS